MLIVINRGEDVVDALSEQHSPLFHQRVYFHDTHNAVFLLLPPDFLLLFLCFGSHSQGTRTRRPPLHNLHAVRPSEVNPTILLL